MVSSYIPTILFFIVTVVKSSASPITPQEVPNPILHYSGCGRHQPSYVCDPSLFLSPSDLKLIDKKLDYFKNNFEGPLPCPSQADLRSYEVSVAVVKKMRISPYADELRAAGEFARKLFDYWGIGDSQCNNGVLLFLSVDDRVGYIATGSGAKIRLNDYLASSVITSYMGSHLRKAQYGAAIRAGLERIDEILKMKEPQHVGSFPGAIISFFVFMWLMIFAIAIGAGYQDQKRNNLLKKRVAKLENDRDSLNQNEFEIDQCPICLNDLTFPDNSEVVVQQRSATDRVGRRRQNSRMNRFLNELRSFKEFVVQIYGKLQRWAGIKLQQANLKWRRFKIYLRRKGYLRIRESNSEEDFDLEFAQIQEKEETMYGRNAFAVRCGHIFCESCIKPWLEKHDSCPICKRPVLAEPQEEQITNIVPPTDVLNPQAFAVRNTARRRVNERGIHRIRSRNTMRMLMRELERELWWDSLRFRARRLHYYHPRYVNVSMVEQFSREPATSYLSRHEHFVRQQQRRTASSSNSRSTSRGFGGGRSSGGGGGRW